MPRPRTETLIAFLKDAAPWGVEVSVEGGGFDAGQGYMVDTAAPALVAAREALHEAYGVDVIETGSGGSIPLVPMLDRDVPRHRRADAGAPPTSAPTPTR